jgi:hypothetical protein
VRKKRRHWYMQYIRECVLCGATRIIRERRYGKPPAKAKRYENEGSYACSDHFLFG